MSVQRQIDDQLEDKLFPRVSIMIKNETGSFDLLKGMRLTLKDCSDVTLNSSEEDCQVNFVDCDGVTVSDFKKGVLRFTRCASIDQITAEDAEVHFGDAEVETLELTRCRGAWLNSTIQDASLTGCEAESLGNSYESLLVSGGRVTFRDDECQSITIEDKANLTFHQMQIKELSLEQASATLVGCQTESLKLNDARFSDIDGEHQEVSIEGEKSSVTFKGSSIETLDASEGTIIASKVEFQDTVTLDGGRFIGTKLSLQGDFSAENGEQILQNCEAQSSVSFTSSRIRIDKSSFLDDVEVQEGSLESSDSEYQKDLSVSEGTLLSRRDTFTENLSLEDVLGANSIHKGTGILQLDITGAKTAGITLNKVEAVKADISEVGLLYAAECDFQQLDLEAFTHAVLDECMIEMATIEDGPFLNASSSVIDQGTITSVQQAITADLTDLVAQDSGIVDDGSSIAADSCFIQSRNSEIIALSCLINNIGGNITGTDTTVVITKGGEILNPDGLTMGEGFEPDESGGSLKFDGLDLTLQSTLGNVDIISRAGDITLTADLGNILANAALNVEIGALANIIGLAGVNVSFDAGVDAEITSGANILLDAAGDATLQGSGTSAVASEGVVNIGAPSINVFGVTQFN